MGKGREDRALASGSEEKLPTLENKKSQSQNLLQDLSEELLDMMKKVNQNGVTVESVNASCNCASQIHKLLKLNFDMTRFGKK